MNERLEAIKKLLADAPFIDEQLIDENLFNKLSTLQYSLSKRPENFPKMVNPKNITGVWYFPYLGDENPHILIRSSVPTGSYERILLNSELCELVGNDVVYDYDRDLIGGDTLIKGQQEELFREIEDNDVYTVFIKERDV